MGRVNKIRIARLDQPDPTVGYPYPPGYWRGQPFTNPDINYTALPTQLLPKSPATDPIYPFRSPNDFYINSNLSANGIYIEFLHLENYITEVRPSPSNPDSLVEVSTLDTLYLAYGPYPSKMFQPGEGVSPLMTVYHGSENAMLVFSGHDIVSFRRAHCLALVKFVLNDLWHMPHVGAPPQPPGPLARAVAPMAVRRPPLSTPLGTSPQQLLGGPERRTVGTSKFLRLR